MFLHVFQHRQGVKGGVSSAGHPRHRRRSDRFLPRFGHLRAVSACRGAPVGGGRRAQRHRALRSVPSRDSNSSSRLSWLPPEDAARSGRPRRAHTHACRVGFLFTQGWGRTPSVLALELKSLSWYLGAGRFHPYGEMHFNDFEPLSILLYLMNKYWYFAPHSICCIWQFDFSGFSANVFFMLLKG